MSNGVARAETSFDFFVVFGIVVIVAYLIYKATGLFGTIFDWFGNIAGDVGQGYEQQAETSSNAESSAASVAAGGTTGSTMGDWLAGLGAGCTTGSSIC